ncbi:uncharacterized protein LOC129774500 [Toxorhynchites rutilus septentrionalis]|uniref:uncharacterized protein LOC129774500 n=1 Tax=Toxorhynchites rutilus septentrionalis TaxID=329112 RepID=UPI00247A18BA|nr:uncharacterized protein LOC129774500 [Toxorhynchites rutilus septentrionalis]
MPKVTIDLPSSSFDVSTWKIPPKVQLADPAFYKTSPIDITFELNTVTYGTACAPFLATRVLKQLADDERNGFPEDAEVLTNDFYVDDLISGANSIEETVNLRKQLDTLLSRGGFQLRKWASNEPNAVADVPVENLAMQPTLEFDRDQCLKTLGLHWEPLTDRLRYKVQLPEEHNDEPPTKRTALSYIARLFDPLGLVGPVVTTAKLFMQSLWMLQDNGKPWGWDKELPLSLHERWRSYKHQLPLLNELRIDRHICCPAPRNVQLHIFSDASERAYGACAYIRSTNPDGKVKIALLTSRSKVAPLKQQSIPRLELCGALIAAEIHQKVKKTLRIFFLAWWSGPVWIQMEPDQWPIEQHSTPQTHTIPYQKLEGYQRMLRITSYCRRFLRNCRRATRKKFIKNESFLQAEEIKASEGILIALIQQQTFPLEWAQLSEKRPLSTKSRLRWFSPFMSDEGVIRIGGRLSNAQQSFDSKHQILLPANHPFSFLLVKQFHERNLHAHPQLLITFLRNRYWIIGAGSLARRVVHTCVACFRAQPKKLEQFMGDLPRTRVTASRPFAVTGVDYWGPLLLRPVNRRSAARKAYVAVFVCFCTKAVHIELVVDLTTAKFMQAFRRFTSRRGFCSEIYSDNGRNFVGVSNELRNFLRSSNYKQAFAIECTSNNIKWHFNPPKASHFGGLWESAISSAQKHLFRVLGQHKLDYDDMDTLLIQIEGCLNSRPIIPIRLTSSRSHRDTSYLDRP